MGSEESVETPHWTGVEEDAVNRTRRQLAAAEEAVETVVGMAVEIAAAVAVEGVVEGAVEEAAEEAVEEAAEKIEAAEGALDYAGRPIG